MNTCLVERSGNLVSNSPEKVEATVVSIANHVILFLKVTVISFFVDLCSHINDQITQLTGPEGFTKNYVAVFKSYFCKYVCQKEWDNFYEEDILMNEELRDNARAVINEQSEGEFQGALYDSNSGYALLVRYVLDSLVDQALFKEERGRKTFSLFEN
jgi:hypothetical protein